MNNPLRQNNVQDTLSRVQERMRQEFKQQAAADHAKNGKWDDAGSIDKETFVNRRMALEDPTMTPEKRENIRAYWEEKFEKYSMSDGKYGLSEEEFLAVINETAIDDVRVPLDDKPVSEEERIAIIFRGNGELAGQAVAERDRLFGDKATLDRDTFMAQARVVGLSEDDLGKLFDNNSADGKMTREQFINAFAIAKGNSTFREILDNPTNVNSIEVGDQDFNDAQAQEAFKASEPAAQEKLKALPADQQKQYNELLAKLENDPQAKRALQSMLVDSRLPGNKPGKEGANLLASLHKLSTQEVNPKLAPERGQLLADTIQEVATPSAIAQHNRGTCAATTAQILMASTDPAEYVRLVGGLASPSGKVVMRNGDTLQREDGTETPQTLYETDDKGNVLKDKGGDPKEHKEMRSVSSRLFQPAAMEYANGDKHYDNATDRHFDKKKDAGSGLSGDENARLTQGLTGKETKSVTAEGERGWLNWVTEKVFGSEVDKKPLVERIEKQIKAGRPVQVGLDWGDSDSGKKHSSHKVLVTSMDANQVYYTNPWGQKERMSRTEFEKRVKNASVDD